MSALTHDSKVRSVGQYLERLRDPMGPMWEQILSRLIPLLRVSQWLDEEVKVWRERRYSPMTTLMMFVRQVMSADQGCKDAVAREAARESTSRSENTGPYCRARQRLPLKLIERFAREVVIEWHRPAKPKGMDPALYAAMPDHLTLREARVGNWTIVSSLLDAREVSRMELSDRYCQRWQVEVDLRSIKSVMQMDILLCHRAIGVRPRLIGLPPNPQLTEGAATPKPASHKGAGFL